MRHICSTDLRYKIRLNTLFFVLAIVCTAYTQPALDIQNDWLRVPDRKTPFAQKLAGATSNAKADENIYKVWAAFTDKGFRDDAGFKRAMDAYRSGVDSRAESRRQTNGYDAGFAELPVPNEYVEALAALGAEIRHTSRWFNAVSVEANLATIQEIESLPFVYAIQEVLTRTAPLPEPRGVIAPPHAKLPLEDYGPSQVQLDAVNVIPLIERGLTGEGIRIGVFDTGFDTDPHRAFGKLKLISERDFVFGDSEPGFEPGQDSSGHEWHGTAVLSVIGGYDPGFLIGPAHNAEFVLAKTEWVDVEVRHEEDAFVEAVEWMESLGVDVTNTSLGYYSFDDGFGYSAPEFDGRTGVTSIAAQAAFERGMSMITSVGNLGSAAQSGLGTVTTPADAPGAIAVGSVNAFGVRSVFSSVGPTADGRIKPDVMALGEAVVMVTFDTVAGYEQAGGTSFSSPMVCAVAALLLESHPDWSAADVHDALRMTASQASTPDSVNGYGIVNADDADAFQPDTAVRAWRQMQP